MSNVNFTCPYCSFSKQLPVSVEGMEGNCPSCNAVVTISAHTPASRIGDGGSGSGWRTWHIVVIVILIVMWIVLLVVAVVVMNWLVEEFVKAVEEFFKAVDEFFKQLFCITSLILPLLAAKSSALRPRRSDDE